MIEDTSAHVHRGGLFFCKSTHDGAMPFVCFKSAMALTRARARVSLCVCVEGGGAVCIEAQCTIPQVKAKQLTTQNTGKLEPRDNNIGSYKHNKNAANKPNKTDNKQQSNQTPQRPQVRHSPQPQRPPDSAVCFCFCAVFKSQGDGGNMLQLNGGHENQAAGCCCWRQSPKTGGI